MGKAMTILWLVIFVVGLLVAFPQYLKIIFTNKIYTLIMFIIIFLIAFATYLFMNNR